MNRTAFYSIFLLALAAPVLLAHDHYAVGVDANGRLQLYDSTGTAMTNTNLSTVYHLCPRPYGQTFGGYYSISDEDPRVLYPTEAFAFIAYSDGQVEFDGTHHAKTGSNIWCEVTSITGPAGGNFAFWDYNWEYFQTTPTKTFATNTATGGWKFAVSEPLSEPPPPSGAIVDTYYNGDSPYLYMIPGTVTKLQVSSGEDPYGHVHDRGYTADQPGDYYVGFTFYDLGGNGSGGGPLHAASPTYYFHFFAGPSFQPTPTKSGNNLVLTWPSQMGTGSGQTGISFTVQRSVDLANWQILGTVTGTTANTVNYTDTNAMSLPKAFYRLQYRWSRP